MSPGSSAASAATTSRAWSARSSEIDDSRPTVIFAYTIKGNGLPNAGHPQNHSNLLTPEQLAVVAEQLGEGVDDPWRRFPPDRRRPRLCARTAARLRRAPVPAAAPPAVPARLRPPR